MQTDAPKWRVTSYREIVKASARELEIRNTAWMVLGELLAVMNYKTGLARIGTPRICDKIGRCERSVKAGLQVLRDVGLIYYEGRAGGGKTALYGFRYTRDAVFNHNQIQSERRRANFAPLIVGQYLDKGCKILPQGVQKIQSRGAKIAPPSSSVNIYQEDDKAPAGRGAVPDAPDGGCTVEPVSPTADRPKRPMLAGEKPYQWVERLDREDAEALRASLELTDV